ncbi:MAG: DUF4876 domain-containing protein [Candidatus Pseudobacter hemicellulosilyticus]|uniref:DUF4876 domain-containing protein n=1 Tax=Candidatus Pseudobacter hemicellulosilyticus TaxID=3121375 RepID=A0AAJ5WRT2_9BACT|nr:MAG: DUF4876 domain-containing protein [Pseudobacter sp.]
MKKLLYLMLLTVVGFYSCKKDDKGSGIFSVTVQLKYPENAEFGVTEGVKVKISSASMSYDAMTDASGKVTFGVPVGIYELSVTDTRSDGTRSYIYNGLQSNITVTGNWQSDNIQSLTLEESQAAQVVIKEMFVGGTPKDDGSGAWVYDKYIILYNNSASPADLTNLGISSIGPFNATGTNAFYGTDGELVYKNEGWVPAVNSVWYFQQQVTLAPGKQLVIALNNAVNTTLTVSKSINFDNPEYYAMYDLEDFDNANYYVSPAASIPTSHYVKAIKYGTANAWILSVTSPGLFIFKPEGKTPVDFANDVSVATGTGALASRKVPVEWVVDAVEAYELNANNRKRFTATLDAGYVYHTNRQGYSIYRNVDKAATEAIPENAGKLVYDYNLGTVDLGGATDPSGIDAEASAKKGARIVYQDTNNSSNDFHMRSKASLRTN